MKNRRSQLLLLPAMVLLLRGGAAAFTLYQSDDDSLSVRLSGYVKNLTMGLDTSLPGSDDTVENFSRARLMLEGDVGARLSWTVHYEHFLVVNPTNEATAGFFAGSASTKKQRLSLLPLDWTIKETGSLLWQHELDRLNLRLILPSADIVVGRQAISWGVGRFWTPSDIFVAFSPVEIDREYKTGVDAVSAKVPLGQSTQLEAVYAAFDEDFRSHSVGARLRTTVANFDLGMMAAKSFRDFVTGPFYDGEIRGVGVRGEFTFTHNTAGAARERKTFFRAVSSVDYRFAGGLYALLEYYYNGFGTADSEKYLQLFNSERVKRGENFNVGLHYLGGALGYEVHPLVNTNLFTLWNLRDQSFLIGPRATVSLTNEADLKIGAYFPVGKDPRDGGLAPRVRSEFGLYPTVYYLQLRQYF